MKPLRISFRIAILAAAAACCAATVHADTITATLGPGNCASCFGSGYTLTVTGASLAGSSFTVTLTIDTSGYSGPGTFVSAVDFKVSNSLTTIALTGAPGGTAGWTTSSNEGVANGGCTTPGSGFGCSQDPAPVSLAPVGGTLVWTWNITIPAGTLFQNIDNIHIGAKYNNATGTLNGNITSQFVPEPGTVALFGTGLLVVAGFLRRRLFL